MEPGSGLHGRTKTASRGEGRQQAEGATGIEALPGAEAAARLEEDGSGT